MAIKNFIDISLAFAHSVDNGASNVFLGRRIRTLYKELSLTDRLRIHGIIDSTDYLENPPANCAGLGNERILSSLETAYHQLVKDNIAELLAALNKHKIGEQEVYEKIRNFGCPQIYIAMDMVKTIEEKKMPPDTILTCTL